ncbi:hypothetical protein P280DRAFT_5003 [Massarina eburnea CBS 473.64]|uniref:Extracellular membrane protein CFEM domain-containing protein n=1 Tax=Massarina eburnea CBS 473.64 TaxID=1395130 RepID=A0A6A6SJ33_9PLEO|nr:hypothetical protein P280DRAFT_5003 [Massarina eburnea CBS 473.64]
MPPSHLGWLCLVLPFATPQQTVSGASQSSLPGRLQKEVPACAQPCLQKSLAEQFPLACTVPPSLSCLCSTYSIGGESLGEVALGCVYASCSSVNQSAEAYNVCLGQTGSVKPTLSVLTISARTSTISSAMSSSSPVVTTKPSTITSNTLPPQPISTESVIVDSISSAPAPTTTPSTTTTSTPSPTTTSTSTATTSAAAGRPQTMKPAEIAGLAVAAAAVFLIAIGLMALSIFLRKRRERRRRNEAINEKLGLPSSPMDFSDRFSQSFGHSQSTLDLSNQFPQPPATTLQKPVGNAIRVPRTYSPPRQNNHPTATQLNQANSTPVDNSNSTHPPSRPPIALQNKSSDSSISVNQIGLAISAEVPRQSKITGGTVQPIRRLSSRKQRQRSIRRGSEATQRPDSDVTQYTVFEEDDVVEAPEVRRQTALLPTPPIPIPPIRSFQPSRPPPPRYNPERPARPPMENQQPRQRSELFLDVPILRQESQPPRIFPTIPLHSNESTQKPQLASPIQILPPQRPVVTNTSTPEPHRSGDIPDYYFTSERYQTPKNSSRTDDLRRLDNPSQGSGVKPKGSSSNVSGVTSRASTNIRDSFSSQTSFESADLDDPTPEDEINGKLSPVPESPISNLRYPKVPRASNQLVPRSPQSQKSQDSPRWFPEPSSLLVKRRGDQGALRLGSPLSTGSPVKSEMRNHLRQNRQHMRSSSDDIWSPVQTSERFTRTQSGMWPPKSPAMYEPDVVRPLSIRPKPQGPQFLHTPRTEITEALKSPAWVPRLTPTRQGEDLLISVTYSKPRPKPGQ